MFGSWRTWLAAEVLVSHILLVPVLGGYAVFSFFVLSGYLMTLIMHETYGYSRAGFARYATNRALRLYPAYWFALLVGVAVIAWTGPQFASSRFAEYRIPATASGWAHNLTMIFPYLMPNRAPAMLSPPSWALTVEITHYLAIGLGLSRTARRSWIWLAAAVLYLALVFASGADPALAYSAVPAGSLPFAVGALAWHYRAQLLQRPALAGASALAWLLAARWAVLLVALAMLWADLSHGATFAALWINALLSALIVVRLSALGASPARRALDARIGDFSYPTYLLHMQLGVLSAFILFGPAATPARSVAGALILALTAALTGVLALVTIRLIDPAIERIRRRIRRRARASVRTQGTG